MTKVLRIILSILLAGWLVASLVLTARWSDNRRCAGIAIEVNDTAERRFVTAPEIARDLSTLGFTGRGRLLNDIDTDSIERFLASNDKIERVTVVRLTNDSILIKVDPMIPVARVFDRLEGASYYVNRSGKHIKADARYHINVPVIEGAFPDTTFTPIHLLPLIDYISADSVWNHLVTMIKVDSPTDIILIPAIKGHVINLGEPRDFDSKFSRLTTIYRKIMPVKGWQYYDTLSLKWNGQVVATRRVKPAAASPRVGDDDLEEVDVSTMLVADNIAPGQTKVGAKAHGENDIPAVKAAKQNAKAAADSISRKNN
ncbi:MAG: hypothetical protein J1E84_01805 [Muribaculaceae bacterium]|nr:hypothetical protein [Muribaculaceae bacterium]